MWLVRCSYDIAFAILAAQSGQVYREPVNLLAPTRMIDFALPPIMLILETIVVRDDVWHDRILRPETAPPTSRRALLSEIAHGIVDTIRTYLSVLSGKKTQQPTDTPVVQPQEIPLDDMPNRRNMADDTWARYPFSGLQENTTITSG